MFQLTLIFTILFNDLDRAMAAISKDVSHTLEAQCREWHGVKV